MTTDMIVYTSEIAKRGGRNAYKQHRAQSNGEYTVCTVAMDSTWRTGQLFATSDDPIYWCPKCFPNRFVVVHGKRISLRSK